MSDAFSRDTTPNQILSRLSRADFALLLPHLEAVNLPLRRQLESCPRPFRRWSARTVAARRGRITILDRDALEEGADGTYSLQEYARA